MRPFFTSITPISLCIYIIMATPCTTFFSINCFITKRERGPITLREEKKGEQLRTKGHYEELAEDWL
jgi:hypothetical protein